MATSVSGYSYDVNRSVNDELNFPGVVFTLGTPYVKVDETTKSCEITTEESYKSNIPDNNNVTKKINQVIGQETVIPINAVFKYIVNSYDFGIYNTPPAVSLMFTKDSLSVYGSCVFSHFFRRYLGDIDSYISRGVTKGITNYPYITNPESQFIIKHADGFTSGNFLSTFNLVANIGSVSSDGQTISGKKLGRAFYTDSPAPAPQGINGSDNHNPNNKNNLFSSYLAIKSITVVSNKAINFKIRIVPTDTLKSHNTIIRDCNIDDAHVNIPVKFDIQDPTQAVLTTSAALYAVTRGYTTSSTTQSDSVTFRNFYKSDDKNYYTKLDYQSNLDVNNYLVNGKLISYGTNNGTATSDSQSFFYDICNPSSLTDDKKLMIHYTSDRNPLNTIIPMGSNIHDLVDNSGLHLFANVLTYDASKSAIAFVSNKFAKIEFVFNSVNSYEESVDSSVNINITDIELSVYNDIKTYDVSGNEHIEYASTSDPDINILVSGSKYSTIDDSIKDFPTSIAAIAKIYKLFGQQLYNLQYDQGEYVYNKTVKDFPVYGAGYTAATISSTFAKSNVSGNSVRGDIPYNMNMVNNTNIVGHGVSILPCATADPLIKINQTSLTIDGYSITDLNGYVKNVLSPDKHTIKFNITAAIGANSSGLAYGNLVFGVKVYNINELDNSSFDMGKYINLSTVKYETIDNQYVSYLLRINSNYIQTVLAGYNAIVNISDIEVSGDASLLTTQVGVKYYTLKHGKTATITLSLSNITDTNEITRYIARVFDVCLIVNKLDDVDIEHPDYSYFDNKNAHRFFLSGLSNDDIIDKTDVVGYSEAGGIGTMFIQEGIKKSEDVPFLFDSDETEQDIINVGDELPSEPLDQAMKLALNYRDLSIKVMPYTLVNYINRYSGAGTIESTGEMKDEYKPYLYDWHVNDGLCLDKDTFVIDLYETSSKCEDTRYWGTYKSTMSFIKSTLYERLDKMNPFVPIDANVS